MRELTEQQHLARIRNMCDPLMRSSRGVVRSGGSDLDWEPGDPGSPPPAFVVRFYGRHGLKWNPETGLPEKA